MSRAHRVGAVLRPTPVPERGLREWLIFLGAIAGLGALFTFIVFVTGKDRPMIVAVPAYQYPAKGQMWAGLTSLEAGSLVVVNPASGPGDAVDRVYEKALEPLRRKGVRLFGYVDSNYGEHSVDHIVAQAKRWVTLYHPAGIFVDQTSVDSSAVPYITAIASRLHALGLQVTINPGQPKIDQRLLDKVDHIINFEGPLSTYLNTTFPDWVHDAPDGLFWHLIYDVKSENEMAEVIDRARDDGAGAVFVTDGSMPNPWDRLPDYWTSERRLADQH